MSEGMSADQAVTFYDLLNRHGVRCWLMGGWGVDALLGRVTRAHKDLDLLVLLADLPDYAHLVRNHGFTRKLEWSESQRIMLDGVSLDSAFVDAHSDGREIDVHVIDIDHEGSIVQLHRDPWPLPADTLSGLGTVTGRKLRCVSRAAQLAMHSNYDLPAHHREDVGLLRTMA